MGGSGVGHGRCDGGARDRHPDARSINWAVPFARPTRIAIAVALLLPMGLFWESPCPPVSGCYGLGRLRW